MPLLFIQAVMGTEKLQKPKCSKYCGTPCNVTILNKKRQKDFTILNYCLSWVPKFTHHYINIRPLGKRGRKRGGKRRGLQALRIRPLGKLGGSMAGLLGLN